LQRERQVLDRARAQQGLDVPPDVEDAMPVVGRRWVADADPIGEEVDELYSLRRPVEPLEGFDEGSRRAAGAPDEDPVARTRATASAGEDVRSPIIVR
jgi:hypothetical protein